MQGVLSVLQQGAYSKNERLMCVARVRGLGFASFSQLIGLRMNHCSWKVPIENLNNLKFDLVKKLGNFFR
jgi:hypothetical protein